MPSRRTDGITHSEFMRAGTDFGELSPVGRSITSGNLLDGANH